MSKFQISVTIPKDWVIEIAFRKYGQGGVLWSNFSYYLKYTVFPIIVYVALCEKPVNLIDLAPGLFVGLIFAVMFSFYQCYKWRSGIIANSVGYSYEATLDEVGVHSNYIVDPVEIKWGNYKSAKIIGQRLELTDVQGGITFVPVNEDTLEAVKFTQERISLANNGTAA